MRELIIPFLLTIAIANGYRNGRGLSAYDDFSAYQRARQYPPFHEQHQPFREQSFKSQKYTSFRPRPFRQEPSYHDQSSFRDQSLLRDYSAYKNQQFSGDQLLFRDNARFKGTSFAEENPFADQQYREYKPQTLFKNEQVFNDQPQFDNQYSYQQQSLSEEIRPPANAEHSYIADAFEKPLSSYETSLDSNKEHESMDSDRRPLSFGGHSSYLKYGNHGLGFASIPLMPSDQNPLPLAEDASTTAGPPAAPTATHKPLLQSTVSVNTSAVTRIHTSSTLKSQMALAESSQPTTQTVKSDKLADVAATQSTQAAWTKPSESDSTRHASSLDPGRTSLTTSSSLSVMVTETPIISFERNTLPPIQFHTTKLTGTATPSTFYIPGEFGNKIQQSVLNYLRTEDPNSTLKGNLQSSVFNYILPEVPNNSLNNNIQSSMLNYLLPDDSKNALKSNIQSSFLNYLLQQQQKRGMSFQQSPMPGTLNYMPLNTLTERSKFTLPIIPISSLTAVSRPMQTINYLPTTMPRVSFMADTTQASSIPLVSASNGIPGGISSNIQARLPSISNSLPMGMSGDISSAISTNLPTLNFGQSFQNLGQIRQFEVPRSQQYSTGLQLQLGGFGGVDYALQPNNPVSRPMELGIAKVGLSLPELPQPHVPTFAKVGFGQQLW